MIAGEKKEKLIELRGQGFSFDKISQEINVSKPTLLKLAGELNSDIERAKYFHKQSIMERLEAMEKHKLESLCLMNTKARKELERRLDSEMDKFSNADLMKLVSKSEEMIQSMVCPVESGYEQPLGINSWGYPVLVNSY